MSSSNFVTRENINMLWEIIIDHDRELVIKLNDSQLNSLREKYIKQINTFYAREKEVTQSLIEMNKKFISQMISQIDYQKPKKLDLSKLSPINDPLLVTAEELHADKVDAFEKELARKKNEFDNALNVVIPNPPKFSDDKIDKPIGEMEELIARTLAERNFQINQINQNANKEDAERWLKGENTSIKEAIRPDLTQKKQISWGENIEFTISEPSSEQINDDIFSKLKKVETGTSSNNDIEEIKRYMINVNDRLNSLENLMKVLINKIK
jgi:hypothetical protein